LKALRFILLISLFAVTSCSSKSLAPPAGINITRFRQVDEGIWAGGRPGVPGQDGLKELAAAGFKTVIDLEGGWWHDPMPLVLAEEQAAKSLNLQFFSVPFHPFWPPQREQVDSVLALLRDPARQPVYVHCHEGKDRTGLVVGIYRIKYQGWTADRAYGEMVGNGFSGFFLFRWKHFFYQYAETLRP
jgi:tyrosine-protein phosphatase SIW14